MRSHRRFEVLHTILWVSQLIPVKQGLIDSGLLKLAVPQGWASLGGLQLRDITPFINGFFVLEP